MQQTWLKTENIHLVLLLAVVVVVVVVAVIVVVAVVSLKHRKYENIVTVCTPSALCRSSASLGDLDAVLKQLVSNSYRVKTNAHFRHQGSHKDKTPGCTARSVSAAKL